MILTATVEATHTALVKSMKLGGLKGDMETYGACYIMAKKFLVSNSLLMQ